MVNPNLTATAVNPLKRLGSVVKVGGIDVTVIDLDENGDVLKATTIVTPPDSEEGFAPMCVIDDLVAKKSYRNTGTRLVSVFNSSMEVTSDEMDEKLIKYAEVTISAADIVATTAGTLGHASGVVLVAAPGATKVLELISAVMISDYSVAAYTAGGNLTVNIGGGGAAITGVVSAANSLGATADKINQFVPLAATGTALTANTSLNLVAASAFTQPGTAAGVIRMKVAYRIHTTGL